jgi:hypothetical protein
MTKMIPVPSHGLSKLRMAGIKTLIVLKGAFTAIQLKYAAPESRRLPDF